ncbi:LysE family translocator [Hyphomicrobium sp.]|uniref:LysE family translocator n=1 Tax=Hyphomicrobium sp. TaxID=82 RepID=UPI002D790EA0|nr:LysE family translocator [Hyphomicrobium sp.]HET6387751.1 LysE family translocator [Hyphomicrobium sp.]
MTGALQELTVLGVPLAFIWLAFLVELTPGPNMTYLAVVTLADGRRAGFTAVAGVASGLLLIGILAALGVAAAVSQSRLLYEIIRWAGALYMLWLAYDVWRGEPATETGNASGNMSSHRYYFRGFLTNVLNPKAAVFYIAVLPQFIDPDKPLVAQTMALTIAYVVVATVVHGGIVALAARARPLLANTAQMQVVRRVLAIGLLLVALWLLWATAEAPAQPTQ